MLFQLRVLTHIILSIDRGLVELKACGSCSDLAAGRFFHRVHLSNVSLLAFVTWALARHDWLIQEALRQRNFRRLWLVSLIYILVVPSHGRVARRLILNY